jgi:GNAT superfamily N-acetyltransferase
MAAINNMSLYFWPNRAMDLKKAGFLNRAVDNAKDAWEGRHAECWDLHVCGVHPDFQGQGIGLKLVQWGIDCADKEHVCVSVMCGEKNRMFYEKAGLVIGTGRKTNKDGVAGGGSILFREAR